MSAKRLREDTTSEVVAPDLQKRAKVAAAAISAASDELICPITHDLLFRPVRAGDGRFYEEWAIRRWIAARASGPSCERTVRSPVTNEAMSCELSGPNQQITNVVKALVESGELPDEVRSCYLKKVKEEARLRAWLTAARCTNPDNRGARMEAIFSLTLHYRSDNCVTGKDHSEVRKWSRVGMELGCVRCMGVYGTYLLQGMGGKMQPVLGMHYATAAAAAGSDVAAYRLGMTLGQKAPYRNSLLDPDVPRAIEYLKQVVEKSTPLKHIGSRFRRRAEEALKELVAQVDEDSE